MNDAIMIRTARDCAALAAKRFPEVADCDFRELFLAAILKAVAVSTVNNLDGICRVFDHAA